jgi:ketosteroid isomerase-like protein
MSQEDVELVGRAVMGWNERGVEALVEVLDPDVAWHPPRESMEPGLYRGHESVRDYLGRLGEIFEESRVELVDVTSVGDDLILAVVRIVGTSSKFGAIDAEWAWLVTVRNGKGTHVATFVDKREALRAARVSE